MGNLKIKGESKHIAKPDWIRLIITLSSKDKDATTAMKNALEQHAKLAESFKSLGLELMFSNSESGAKYQYQKKVISNKKDRILEYFYVDYYLRAEFAHDSITLFKAQSILSKCENEPEFNVVFFIKDEQSVKDILLEKATKDAVHQAQIVTNAANVKILGIKEIIASPTNPSFEFESKSATRSRRAVLHEDSYDNFSFDNLMMCSEMITEKSKNSKYAEIASQMFAPMEKTFFSSVNVIFKISSKEE